MILFMFLFPRKKNLTVCMHSVKFQTSSNEITLVSSSVCSNVSTISTVIEIKCRQSAPTTARDRGATLRLRGAPLVTQYWGGREGAQDTFLTNSL